MHPILRIAIAVAVMSACYGAWFLFYSQPDRSTPWPVYLGLAFIAGFVGLVGESVADFIAGSDTTSDPLAMRAGRLVLMLVSAAAFLMVIFAILASM